MTDDVRRDDRVLTTTRALSAFIAPFLLVAFVDADNAQLARDGFDFLQRLPHCRFERMPRDDGIEAVLPRCCRLRP